MSRLAGDPFRARPVVVGFLVLAASTLVGCGDAGDTTATAPPTTLSGSAAVTTPPGGPCISRMPGEALGEDEAVVRFSPSGVCPSYVTVEAGTTVRWTNDHTAPVTVTLAASGAAPADAAEALAGKNPAVGGTVVFATAVAPGATLAEVMDDAGVYYFRLDLIPTFLGTVEVK